MATEVLMPKLSSTMTQGYVTQWIKQEGEAVKVGDVIFEVMTDKIAIEVEAYDEGILLKQLVKVGEVVPVNSVIAYIGKADEQVTYPSATSTGSSSTSTNTIASTVKQTETSQPVLSNQSSFSNDIRATPAARKAVKEHNLSLHAVYQSIAPKQRLHLNDVLNYLKQSPQDAIPSEPPSAFSFTPFKGIRKAVADQMIKSVNTAPHVTLHAEVDVSALLALKQSLALQVPQHDEFKISITHLLAFLTTKVLTKYPNINAHALEDGIYGYPHVHLGIATALDQGLIVPNIKNAQHYSLVELAKAIKDVTSRAKNGQLKQDEYKGGTFTITSLGSTEVLYFNPIINVPEVAILAVGKMVDKIIKKEGEFSETKTMTLSLSFDHRAIDGYPAALFLSELVELIQDPIKSMLY